MKNPIRWSRSVSILGAVVVAVAVSIHSAVAAPVPTGKPDSYPAWWFERGIIRPLDPNKVSPVWPADYPEANDFNAANIGQVKYFATMACDEMDAHFPGGASTAVRQLVASWYLTDGNGDFILDVDGHRQPKATAGTDDFSVVNLGQLKAVAKVFYQSLLARHVIEEYPWEEWPADDYAAANVGQIKFLFAIDFGFSNSTLDTDGDGIPDWYEIAHGMNPNDPSDAQLDFDGDGLSNLAEYLRGSNPDYFDTVDPADQSAVKLRVYTPLEK